eukprot:CAMPEP_0118973720 /NCGR_PEP_ID=MMETSP1173-20130426/10803_1 /TAXON_ID=1034831 /ORGANISM="Rhizochromulina marina cf, Strain CCMP1243" /LENGTH=263 /DNA_ID=CAMNT_0006923413 /DNA_START=16 /DNA_END=807 /DNA_ORIENTATION=+
MESERRGVVEDGGGDVVAAAVLCVCGLGHAVMNALAPQLGLVAAFGHKDYELEEVYALRLEGYYSAALFLAISLLCYGFPTHLCIGWSFLVPVAEFVDSYFISGYASAVGIDIRMAAYASVLFATTSLACFYAWQPLIQATVGVTSLCGLIYGTRLTLDPKAMIRKWWPGCPKPMGVVPLVLELVGFIVLHMTLLVGLMVFKPFFAPTLSLYHLVGYSITPFFFFIIKLVLSGDFKDHGVSLTMVILWAIALVIITAIFFSTK